MEIIITKATEKELPCIHDLAYRIWPVAFNGIISTSQMKYMLDWMYSLPSLKRQLESGHQFLLAQRDTVFTGFCSFQFKNTYTKLHKLYVLPEEQGKGIGRSLLDQVTEITKNRGLKAVHLNVNRHNKAISFYEKLHFKKTHTEDIDIGHGFFMNDYVMEKEVG